MALTESKMMSLGTAAPKFSLPNVDGSLVSQSDFSGKPLLVIFMCNHCPYVKHLTSALAQLGRDYGSQEIGIVAIQSNDVVNYPDDSPEKMKEEVVKQGYTFPYLYDENQAVARSYTAACTPDFFLFDASHQLAYRGRFDETMPTRVESGVYDSTGNEAHGKDLRTAMDAVLAGKTPASEQSPSKGCNIKWKEN